MSLYITAAQPNPPGKDVASPGLVRDDQLNAEWVEFRAQASRDLINDTLTHVTFNSFCQTTGAEQVITFPSLQLQPGESVRVHTGRGTYRRDGAVHHVYLQRAWFIWNNRCGDRATLSYNGTIIDSAYYDRNPPEGILQRVTGTDRLAPSAFSRSA